MVNWAVDIESVGLDGGFRLGCIIDENGKSHFFKDKEEFWKKIIKRGKAEKKRGHMLNVYAHNHNFDFHKYADLEDNNIVWFSTTPFITAYRNEIGKEAIKFLDSMAIVRGSLGNLAKWVGMEKSEVDEKLLKEKDLTEQEEEKLRIYCENDTRIVWEFIRTLNKKLKDEGINIKRIYTMPQMAMSYVLNLLKREDTGREIKTGDGRIETDFFWDKRKGWTHRTKFSDELQGIYYNKEKKEWKFRGIDGGGAYRGAGVRIWRLGKTEDVNYLDCNSLYPFALKEMKFPNLKTERKIYNPLKEKKGIFILEEIGISKALVYNKSCEIGLLPTRTKDIIYYPEKGKYLLGTWTNLELKKAIEEGYEILDIEWTIIYDETNNPFKEIMKKLYRKREEGDFEKGFYKGIMNSVTGKFGQKKVNEETIICDIEQVEEKLKEGYEIVGGEDYTRILTKQGKFRFKPFYTPIIPTLITAWSRCYMYDHYKKQGKENLIYSDTDSCIFIDKNKAFKISKEIGDFKIEAENTEIEVIVPKVYRIGEDIRLGGYSLLNNSNTKDEIMEMFKKGIL